MSSVPTVDYDIGQEFLMTLFLTPPLQELHNKERLIVEAVYKGTLPHDEVMTRFDNGKIKILALEPSLPEHHVVEYADQLWVHDLIGIKGTPSGEWTELDDARSEIENKHEEAEEITAVEPEVIATKTVSTEPRAKIRHMLHGSKEWNIEGLKDARRDTDGEIQVCSISGDELFYVQDDGLKIKLRTHGVCAECNRLYGERAMHNDGMDRSKWPITYLGGHCVECWPNKK